MSLKILIVGAGVCGPALALLLKRSNPKHAITIIERFPTLRTGGQQLDIKGAGVAVVKHMGLLEELRTHCIQEEGLRIIDKHGSTLMEFGVQSAEGKQEIALTNEFEFMRGDMVKMFYDATLAEEEKTEGAGGLKYEFDKTITALEQDENAAIVTFSDGKTDRYDLVVAADGQASRTRRLLLGQEASDKAFKSLNVQAAFYNIPRLPSEDAYARAYVGAQGKAVLTRTGNLPTTQIYFFSLKDKARNKMLAKTYKLPLDEQKEAWATAYSDAGWECPRIIEAMRNSDDFYACEIAQVKTPNLQKNRVVLLGDAGYCPSAFTGEGTKLSLIGAYVLAGELARNKNDVRAALVAYEKVMRAPIDESQQLGPGATGTLYPSSAVGIRILSTILWTISCLRVDKLIRKVTGVLFSEQPGWKLPEYPELPAASSKAS